jgi:hypothetical protein
MRFKTSCTFISADDCRTDLTVNNVSEAQAAWEDQDWRNEVARAENVTGQFPCVWFVRSEEPTTALNISGEDGGRVRLLLQVVVKPGILGIFGREAVDLDIHGASADQVRLFVQQFFNLDKQALYAWAKSVPKG